MTAKQYSLGTAFRSALIALVAVLASFGATYALCGKLHTNATPAVLAAALTVGLMRRTPPFRLRSVLGTFLALPVVALAAGLIGHTLLAAPVIGALLFSGGIALSIWLRQFGDAARTTGRIIALPLMAILIVPVHLTGGGATLLMMIAAGTIAFASVTTVAGCVERFGGAPEPEPERPRPRPPRDKALPIATRMAAQMLVALALAFAVGLFAFPTHWPWIVLTAFIVCSGAIGRGDAVYKALLRLGGAIAGTLAATLVALIAFPNDVTYAAAIFGVLFLGMWLRPTNYAYWAACATLLFALLQGSNGPNAGGLFAMRVACIAIGALCGVAATWFVYPIRTEQVVRRRVADALAALRNVVTGAHEGSSEAKAALLDFHASELERIAPPVRIHRAVFGTKKPDEHPATWLDLMDRLLDEARNPGFNRASMGEDMRRLRAMLKREKAGNDD